jgi:hypothetical protein
MNSTFKRIASHVVAVVAGLLLATQCRSPRVEFVEKEVVKEVKVEVVKEVEVEKIIEKIVKVPRKCPKPLHTKEEVTQLIEYHVSIQHPNRLSLLAGSGKRGLNTKKIPGGYEVSQDVGLVGGVGYSVRLYKQYNLGVQVFTNSSVMGEFGIDF